MQVEAGLGEPLLHVLVLVGSVVVQDHVDLQSLGCFAVDLAHELQELFVAVPGQALADDSAGEHVEGGKLGGRPVALVVVGHRAGPTFFMGDEGWVRSSACREVFSSIHRTTAFSGR